MGSYERYAGAGDLVVPGVRHAVRVAGDGNTLIQTPVQFTVSPVLYAIALRPEEPGQLRAAVSLACQWWGGLRFPWLPVGQDGAVVGGAERLCEVLDVAGIIDLTRPDDREPVPAGLAPLGLPMAPAARWPRLGLPVRGVVAPVGEAPLITAGQADGDGFDPVPLLGALSNCPYARRAERCLLPQAASSRHCFLFEGVDGARSTAYSCFSPFTAAWACVPMAAHADVRAGHRIRGYLLRL